MYGSERERRGALKGALLFYLLGTGMETVGGAERNFFPDILWIETPGRRGKKYWGFTGIFYGNVLSLLEMGRSYRQVRTWSFTYAG